MWPALQSARRNDGLPGDRRRARRRRRLNLPGDHFLEERVLLSSPDPSGALVSPQFTDLVQPLPVNLPTIALPVVPPADGSAAQTPLASLAPVPAPVRSSGGPGLSPGRPDTGVGPDNLGLIDDTHHGPVRVRRGYDGVSNSL